jgi:hypothetical protein
MNETMNQMELSVAVVLGSIHPALGRRFLQGRSDAERGEVTVMWVSMTVLMAAALGLLIWNKIKAKEGTIDMNTPAAGVGG